MVDDEVIAQLAAMPVALLVDYADAVDAAATAPWSGEPINAANPTAEVRRRLFGPLGAAQLVYLVVEHAQEIHLLRITVLELPD
ncbi:MAG: hypothetical protein L0H84_09700 [Pseudonocardia sp.]|nr:hypothetical protein [Pseudonocardia sp.]